MIFFRTVAFLFTAVALAAGGPLVDVSTRFAQSMNPGDTMQFLISNLSLPNANTVQFQLLTAPIEAPAGFEAELISPDGSVSAVFPGVVVLPAQLWSSGYTGAVTSISGTVTLSGTLSHEVFQNTRSTLVLHDITGQLDLGLPGYSLKNALMASVSTSGATAGAVVNKVLYQEVPPAPVPESGSGALVAGAGLLLCVFSRALKRISERRIQ